MNKNVMNLPCTGFLKMILFFVLLFLSISVHAQNVMVKGTVKDAVGNPVIGASVSVPGTTIGTITDVNGDFVLSSVPSNGKISCSYIGLQKQIVDVKGKTHFTFTMTDNSKKLDEVVVTALGMKRSQKALGYAVAEVKGDAVRTANTISPVTALEGKVAGVQITQSDGGMFGATRIQIRGASTLSGNNQPIFVIDGVILDNETSGNTDADFTANAGDYGNELKNLNPDDFASVSILRGAAATALYGSRGLNGAVVITTKSGKGSKGLGVSISQTFGWDVVTRTPDVQDQYGYGMFPGERTYTANHWDPNSMYTNSSGMPSLIGANGLSMGWGPKFDGRQMENFDGSLTTYSPYKNGMKDYFQTGFNTNTNVSIRGGSDKVTFYGSLSYKDANATIPNNTFQRYGMLLKGSYKINNKLDIAGSVTFDHSKPRNAAREIGLYSVYSGLPNFVSPRQWANKYRGEHGGIAESKYNDAYGYVPETVKDLWWDQNQVDNVYKEYVIRPTFEFNYKIQDWVKFKAEANMNLYTRNFEGKQLGSGYQMEGGADTHAQGQYEISSFMKEQFTAAATFTFNKNLGDFNLGGFIRGESYNKVEQYLDLTTNPKLVVPGQFFINNSYQTPKYTGKMQGTKRILSAIYEVSASWKDQLFLDVTGRNDWSSALVYSNRTGNYSFFYPSVSGSWLLNETLKLPHWISLAKVRASWAQVGSDTDPYLINPGYQLESIKTSNGNIYYNDFSSNTLYSKGLKPERKNSWELGLDFKVLENRIGLDATYYKENTTDQIMSIPVPSVSGVTAEMVNAGNIQNQGIELTLNTVPVRTRDLEWDVDLTFTKNVSQIVSLHPDAGDYYLLEGSTNYGNFRVGSVAKVGGAYGMVMSDIAPKRNSKGQQILDWDDEDRAAYAERSNKVQSVGDINPKFLATFGTTLRYKNFNVHVALDARVGGTVASYPSRYGDVTGLTKTSLKYRDQSHGGKTWTSRWNNKDGSPSGSYGITYHDGVVPNGVFSDKTKITGADGNVHNVGGMSYAECMNRGWLEPMHAGDYHYYRNDWGTGVINDDWVHELSYICLREVTIGYSFPAKIAKSIHSKGLGCSLTGRNLCYLYNSLPNHVNPESIRGNHSGEFRSRSYNPYVANFMFTIHLDF